MSRASGVSLDALRPHLFLLRDRDATGHLLRVSGGLDSLVMGEGQILAQVKQVRPALPVPAGLRGLAAARASMPGLPWLAGASAQW